MDSFAININKYRSLLHVSPRPTKKFNETLGPNGRLYLSFNEAGNRLLPAVVQNNLEFFSALRIIGLFPVAGRFRSVFFPHKRKFSVLSQVQMTSSTSPVIGFQVPEMGYPVLCKSLLSKCMVYDGDHVLGDGHHLVVKARELLVGEEVVVFGVQYSDKLEYYMWDVDHIYPVEASGPALFVRNGASLTLVSDIEGYTMNMPFETVNWEILHQDLVAKDKNLLLDIDGQYYNVYSEPTVKVCVENKVAYDSCHDKVSDVEADDGYYQIGITSSTVFSKSVLPLVDSPQMIHRAYNCVVKTSLIRDLVLVPRTDRKFVPPRYDMSACGGKIKSYNVGAIHVPYFLTPTRKKQKRVDYYKDFLNMLRIDTKNSIVTANSTGYSKFLCDNYLFANYDQVFKLSWTPDTAFWAYGISNSPRVGYFMVVYKDIPDEVKHLFRYPLGDRLYVMFFDPDKWHYEGNSYMPDSIEE